MWCFPVITPSMVLRREKHHPTSVLHITTLLVHSLRCYFNHPKQLHVAVPYSYIYFVSGCTDLWDPKVIRGGMGSHFRIPIYNEISWPTIQSFLDEGTLFIVATNEKVFCENQAEVISPYYSIKFSNYKHTALVVGGETEGVSDSALHLGTSFNLNKVTIPLSNELESLNSVSALSVILFEIKRQFVLSFI